LGELARRLLGSPLERKMSAARSQGLKAAQMFLDGGKDGKAGNKG
jgi:hypothetical protein